MQLSNFELIVGYMTIHLCYLHKGCLISESSSNWLHPPKNAQNHSFLIFYGMEKPSKIKPPLQKYKETSIQSESEDV